MRVYDIIEKEVIKLDKIIDLIVRTNTSVFGTNPRCEKINVGFTNTLYKVNNPLYEEAKELNIFNDEEQKLLEQAYSDFDEYLDSDEFVLVHNDFHFDNIFVDNGKIKIIDFERSMYAPRDFELDILYRMIRKPWKFASEETEKYTDANDYSNIMSYVNKYYPELVNTPNLYERLGIYDIVYFLEQLVRYPELDELKNDVLIATKVVTSKDGKKL